MSKLNIGIAGLGNVGSALVETIEENKNHFFDKSDVELNIVGISAKTKNKKRNFNISNYTWYDDPREMSKDDNCNVIVELIGEEKGISYEIIEAALKNKKITSFKLSVAGNQQMNISEVEVISEAETAKAKKRNIAKTASLSLSSEYNNGMFPATLLVDGNKDNILEKIFESWNLSKRYPSNLSFGKGNSAELFMNVITKNNFWEKTTQKQFNDVF